MNGEKRVMKLNQAKRNCRMIMSGSTEGNNKRQESCALYCEKKFFIWKLTADMNSADFQ